MAKNEEKNEDNLGAHTGVVSRSIVSEYEKVFHLTMLCRLLPTEPCLTCVTVWSLYIAVSYMPCTPWALSLCQDQEISRSGRRGFGQLPPTRRRGAYEAMVKMAQEFSIRYPLVIGQGNFGSVERRQRGCHALYRSQNVQIASELLRDIIKRRLRGYQTMMLQKKSLLFCRRLLPNFY